VIGLLTSSLRARMLSTPEFGAYSLVLSVISLRPLVGSLRLPKSFRR
jgi:O-antigen/teichoic acid export membrane protein